MDLNEREKLKRAIDRQRKIIEKAKEQAKKSS
jgi:two-component SAPR family response regulator